jgi:histone-lysine N-methyltransferase ASH1L
MVATYNINALSGATSARKNRKSLPAAFRAAAIEEDKASAIRRDISGDTLIGAPAGGLEDEQSISPEDEADSVEKQVEQELSEALNIDWSVKKLPKSRSAFSLRREEIAISTGSPVDNNRRRSTRYIKEQEPERKESLSKKLSVLGKRGRASVNEATSRMSRELKRLADTKEFSKEEDLPVIEHIWSKGKLIIPGQEPEKKKKKAEPAPELGKVKEEEQSVAVRKKEKVWLTKGLYAGQEGNVDLFAGYTAKQRKEMAKATANQPKRKILPMPLWAGQRLLHNGRDFKLPFDVCSPLPNGQPKPDEWKKSTRNRFVDDAAKLWKTPKSLDDSKCICSPEEGCGEDCLNRTMFYECDGKNCNAGKEFCKNRAFADLTERRNKGGKYRIGVEVIKTEDRGFGVRSNRCFEPHQIIVEYNNEVRLDLISCMPVY